MYNDIIELAKSQLADSTTVIYTAPAGKKVQIGSILLHNTGSATENLTLYKGGADVADRFLFIALAGNETYEFSPKVPLPLEGGQTLQGSTETAATVNIFVDGRIEQ